MTPITLENVDRVVQLGQLGRGKLGQVAWSPDGRLLAAAYLRGVYLHDAETLEQVRFWETHTTEPNLAFSPDGTLLAAGAGAQVQVWRVDDGALQRTIADHTGAVTCVAWSPDGTLLASGAGETVRLWRVSDGPPLHTLEGRSGCLWSVVFASDGIRGTARCNYGEWPNRDRVR